MANEGIPRDALDDLLSDPQRVAEAGGLPHALRRHVPECSEDREEFWNRLADIHNSGTCDLVAEFAHLESREDSDFFLTRNIFVRALPKLTTDPIAVARTVAHLVIAAGADIAASWPLRQFRMFLDQDSTRVGQILTAIESEPSSLAILLPVTSAAGFEIDLSHFLDEVIRLANASDEVLQRMALASLADLPVGRTNSAVPSAVLDVLEATVALSDRDGAVAATLSASLALVLKSPSQLPRLLKICGNALEKGADWTRGVAADCYAKDAEKYDVSVLELLTTTFVSRVNGARLDNLDIGISSLLQSNNRAYGVELLESLLRRFYREKELKDFQFSKSTILASEELRSYAVTRWLISADAALCEAAASAVRNSRVNDIGISADISQVDFQDEANVLFLARKAIGYLFFTPIALSSFLLSLMRRDSIELIKPLLLNPLLLNYPDSVGKLLRERAQQEPEEIAAALRECMEVIESYLQALRSTSEIKELRMSEEQKAIFSKSLNLKVSKSYEEAQAQSPLFGLIKRSIVLYGRGSVQHVIHADGSSHRADMMFKTQGGEFTFPRMAHIDELGLHFQLRVLRAEKREP
jgi:hypothetical protein